MIDWQRIRVTLAMVTATLALTGVAVGLTLLAASHPLIGIPALVVAFIGFAYYLAGQ